VDRDIIIQGDAVSILASLPSKSIDLVVTSPPYNTGKEYETKLSVDEYRCFAGLWVREIQRIIKPNGSFWLNLGYMKTGRNTTLPLTYLYYPLIEMDLIQEIVWHYEGGMSYKKRFTHRTERLMWYSNDSDRVTFNLDDVRDISLNRTNDKRNNPLGKNPTDYWYFDRIVAGTGKVAEKTEHPCQFPESMIERIIKACSNQGDIVLDPFIGSGTTAVVAKRLGRHYLGIEKRSDYIKITKDRLESEGC
jgi:adenine-specific DNA-methyltransferase